MLKLLGNDGKLEIKNVDVKEKEIEPTLDNQKVIVTEDKPEKRDDVTQQGDYINLKTVDGNNSKNSVQEEVDDFLPNVNLKLFKKILINNTLASADKKLLKDVNDKCEQLSTFLINKDFKQAASILLDGKIVGISSDNIIISYEYEAVVEKADEMMNEIEMLLNRILGKKYRIINIDNDNWSELRPYFVKLLKNNGKIEILPEVSFEKKVTGKHKKRAKEIDDAINIFGEDIIEIK
jgi:hypothetical protein